jgi:hypothetical protein
LERIRIVASGYAVAVVLLVSVSFFAWVELLFPAWVLVLSLYVLITSFKATAPAAPPR